VGIRVIRTRDPFVVVINSLSHDDGKGLYRHTQDRRFIIAESLALDSDSCFIAHRFLPYSAGCRQILYELYVRNPQASSATFGEWMTTAPPPSPTLMIATTTACTVRSVCARDDLACSQRTASDRAHAVASTHYAHMGSIYTRTIYIECSIAIDLHSNVVKLIVVYIRRIFKCMNSRS
jgi:hypothetical protein